MLDLRSLVEGKLGLGDRFYLGAYAFYTSLFDPKRMNQRLGRRRRRLFEGRARKAQAEMNAFLRNFPEVKLNLGCGEILIKGWINIDSREDVPGIDINYDLRLPLPLRDDAADFIYNEHFLEHLAPDEGVKFLKECRRCLKPGGVLRVAMPHIKPVLDSYYKDELNSDLAREMGVKTKAELLNIGFKYWGHQWLYDEAETERRLAEAGFEKVEQKRLNESDYPALRYLETRIGSELIYEAVK